MTDITLYWHDTWQIDGVANDARGQAIPLSDLQFWVVSPSGNVLTLDKNSGVTLSATAGAYTVLISDGQKASFDPSIPYRYFVRAIDTNGGKAVENEGRFIVLRDPFPS